MDKSSLFRSFLGASLCAMLALWPAITWQQPWLLAAGGIAGWLIGYHGDRLMQAVIIVWQGFALFKKIPAVYKKLANFLKAHPLNKTYFARGVMLAVLFLICCVGSSYFIIDLLPGARLPNASYSPVASLITDSVLMFMIGAVIFAFLSLIYAAIAGEQPGNKLSSKYYEAWDFLNRKGLAVFMLRDILTVFWIFVWFVAISLIIVSAYALAAVILIGSFVIGLMFAVIRSFLKIVIAKNDYGFISLIIGMLCAIFAYFYLPQAWLLESLIRIGISVAVGITAGSLSMLVRVLISKSPVIIRGSQSFAQLSLLRWTTLLFREMTKAENILPKFWHKCKKLIPAYITM
ncbi:MAG: hypothetical protein ABIG10_03585 [bacterium]